MRPAAVKPKTSSTTPAKKSVHCQECQATLKIAATALGKKVRCPKCSQTFIAGAATEQPVAPEQAAIETFEPFADDMFSGLPGESPSTASSDSTSQIPDLGNLAFDTPSSDPYAAATPAFSGGYQPYAPPPAKKKKKRRASSDDWQSWLTEPRQLAILMAIVAGVSFILSAIPFFGIFVFFVILVLYFVVSMVGGIWLIVVAFQEDAVQGLLYLFLPFYALFYLITRWDTCRAPFMLCIVSLVSVICSVFGMLIGTVILGLIVGPQR
ncbi:MAG: hypothetical protein Aurels2KO_43400 [Aureliella sp.]